jgi:hypothetical protein
MQPSCLVAAERAEEEQELLAIKLSKVVWKAVVVGPVSGNAPPLCMIAARNKRSLRPPYAVMWE